MNDELNGQQYNFFRVGGIVNADKELSLYSAKIGELYPAAIPYILNNIGKFGIGKEYDIFGVKFFIVQDNIFSAEEGLKNRLDDETNEKFIDIHNHTILDGGGEVSKHYKELSSKEGSCQK